VASLLDAAGRVFGEVGYHAATTNAIAAEGKVSPATLYQFFPNKEAIADALVARYAMDLAKEERAADIQELASAPLEEAIRQLTGVVIEFHRKHPAFRTLYAEAPLSKGTLEQKHLLSQTFIDHLSEVLRARNPKLDKQEAPWSAEIVLTALIGFLPAIARRKASARSRTIDALNQMLVRYLEPVLKPPKRQRAGLP
jgi:AcrR family transcriptional regulator